MDMITLPEQSHQATLERLLSGTADRSIPTLFGQASEEFWLWCFTSGYRSDPRLRSLLPAFPAVEIQERFTGAAGDQTMREAFAFYVLVKDAQERYGRRPLRTILDFGCGWGRVTRLFTREVESQQLWGIDCMSSAIDICRSTNTHSRFELTDPLPPTTLAPEAFDLIYAYSVFSHLSEAAHLAWLEEFRRVLKPGGLLVVTTRPREFILQCAAMREALRHQGEQPNWTAGTNMSFKNTEAALAQYDKGEFLFEPTGGGDELDASFFGEACIPRQYVIEHWPNVFEPVDYIDDRSVCLQNVIVARKR
jgi:2-polyprenyl-3-methyl-5-hydroxy-6-metoxy-1,4-benzoquinol methylase